MDSERATEGSMSWQQELQGLSRVSFLSCSYCVALGFANRKQITAEEQVLNPLASRRSKATMVSTIFIPPAGHCCLFVSETNTMILRRTRRVVLLC
jgi:hypothetical protein